jgi:hypothetical protein
VGLSQNSWLYLQESSQIFMLKKKITPGGSVKERTEYRIQNGPRDFTIKPKPNKTK